MNKDTPPEFKIPVRSWPGGPTLWDAYTSMTYYLCDHLSKSDRKKIMRRFKFNVRQKEACEDTADVFNLCKCCGYMDTDNTTKLRTILKEDIGDKPHCLRALITYEHYRDTFEE